jgi:hypothetical protein
MRVKMTDAEKSAFADRVARIALESNTRLKPFSLSWAVNKIIEARGDSPDNDAISAELKRLSVEKPNQFGNDPPQPRKRGGAALLEEANSNPPPRTERRNAVPDKKPMTHAEFEAVKKLSPELKLAFAAGDYVLPGFGKKAQHDDQ